MAEEFASEIALGAVNPGVTLREVATPARSKSWPSAPARRSRRPRRTCRLMHGAVWRGS